MAKPLIDDALWELVEPLLPKPKPRRFRYPGRKPVDPRAALTGIVFVLKTGIPWEYLPTAEMGISGISCWRKLREWRAAGVWDRLVEVMLAKLHHADKIDWKRAAVDSSSVRAIHGGKKTGPSPVDRRKPGSKHHVITDGNGIPLTARVTKANRNDVTQLERLVDAIPAVRGKVGKPRRRPDELYADRAYDSKAKRREMRKRGIRPLIARRNTGHGSGLGRHRWVVERTIAWLHSYRRLRNRFDRKATVHQAFLTLATALIGWNFLQH